MTRSGRFLSIALAASLVWLPASALPAQEPPRSPKVAGQFYPDNPAELRELITHFLARQPEPAFTQKPHLLIVPHAGYEYSGLVAASGYRHLQGHSYDGVVIVAFTHRLQFEGASVDTREAYATPLGLIPVDQEAVAVLQTYPGIIHNEEAHESPEHSLEVQLPFLQVALGRVRIVPILMGNAGLDDAERLAEALAALATLKDYLFLFSTDLSHYHPSDQAERLDEGTVNAIVGETPQAVHRLFAQGRLEACGVGPIVTSLLLAAKLGYPTRRLLYYANSGDTTGARASVVGYAAIGMFDRAPEHAGGRLSAAAGAALVQAARRSLERAIGPRADLPEIPLSQYPELSQADGVFVTLRKQGQLRGCVGRIQSPDPLARSVPLVALDAALHDGRFPPVAADELPALHVEVSVLTPPVKIADARDIVLGRDGVILESQQHSGVFLPQVWDESGWTRVEFLRELASQKAGLPPDAWQQATLSVFQAQPFEE